jgi:hypothetical protein
LTTAYILVFAIGVVFLHSSGMIQTDPGHFLILAASWLLFGLTHSLLAGTTLERLFGRYSRIAFNCMAVVFTTLPFAIGATLPAIVLWEDPNRLIWVRHGFSVAAVLAFIHTLKFYSLTSFLGLKTETRPLTFSPWHSYVRHPWYFLMLVIIWTQTMTETWLVSASCMTL